MRRETIKQEIKIKKVNKDLQDKLIMTNKNIRKKTKRNKIRKNENGIQFRK